MRTKDHYLKNELLELNKKEPVIFEWLEAGSLDGIWYWDLENPENMWYSAKIKATLGYGVDEIPNKSKWWRDRIFPGDFEKLARNYREHLENPDIPFDCVIRYPHKKGHTVWVRNRGLMIRNDEGKPVRMLGVHLDVTSLMLTRNALKKSNQHLRDTTRFLDSIIDNIPSMVFVKDAESMEYIRLNSAAERILCRPASELLGKANDHISRKNSAKAENHPDQVALRSNGAVITGEEKIKTYQGEKWLKTKRVVIRGEGDEPSYLLGISEDITELRKLRKAQEKSREELKARSKELERSNKDLEQFAFVISHDLHEPLRKIKAFGQLLENECKQDLGDDGQFYLSRMVNASERLETLIQSILQLSRASSRPLDFSQIDLKELVQDCVRTNEFDGEIQANGLPTVLGDATLLGQVFTNLISNSAKFAKPDTPTKIAISENGSQVDHEGNPLVEIVFQDNGIGFSPENSQKIFQIFERLHGRTEFPGTGIGLAICQKIINRHGGEIWAEGEAGVGATFKMTLPGAK